MKNTENKITIQGKDLIEKLGLENLPLESQEKIIKEMSDVVYDRALLRVVEKLSEQEAEEINEYLGNKEYEKADKYIADKVPDFAVILKEEIRKFGEEMIRKVKEKTV